MNRLHDTQRDFSRFVFQETTQLPFGIKANGLSAEQRLSIYRNNTQLGLTEVLRDTYPVVNRLVGDGFFNRLALAYIQSFPPHAASLITYGGHFAALIADFEAVQGLPYLADTASLEWYWHEAYHAAEAQPLALSALAQIDPAAYGELAFTLHPSVRFIESKYPIEHIWLNNQPDYPEQELIDLSAGACRLLLFRPQSHVEMYSLAEADYLFLTGLSVGNTLSQTVESIMTKHPDANIQSLLQQWLFKGLLTDFFMA
jgi:hypothetical protein